MLLKLYGGLEVWRETTYLWKSNITNVEFVLVYILYAFCGCKINFFKLLKSFYFQDFQYFFQNIYNFSQLFSNSSLIFHKIFSKSLSKFRGNFLKIPRILPPPPKKNIQHSLWFKTDLLQINSVSPQFFLNFSQNYFKIFYNFFCTFS